MKAIGKFSISAFLRIILEVLFILGLLAGAYFVFGFIASMINPETPVNPFNMTEGYELLSNGLENNFQIQSNDPGIYNTSIKLMGLVRFQTRNRGFLALFFGVYLVYWGLALVVIMQLRNFLESISEENPFSRENAKRIRTIGSAIIVAFALRIIYLFIAVNYMKNSITVENAKMYLHPETVIDSLHLEFFFVGLVVLVIAEIFRIGVGLKEDQDLTI